MLEGRVERKLNYAFGLALAVLLANALASYWNVRTLNRNARSVVHTREVLGVLEEAMTALTNAESGQRGYLLSGNGRFLEPYRDGVERIPGLVARLEAMTADNPAQRARLSGLRDLVGERLAALQSVIVRKQAAPPGSEAIDIHLERGRVLMEQIRATIGAMKAEEVRLLVERDRASGVALYRTVGTIAVASMVAAALLGVGFALVRRDIHERARAAEAILELNRELERRVEERTAELQRTNRELETFAAKLQWSNRELQEFASVASHDLQEPLRKIQAFGDRLRARCAEGLGEPGRDYLGRMQAAAARMSTLINDLLVFSRVTSKAQPFAPVDLGQVACEVVSDLEGRLQQTGGRVDVDGLPTLEADPIQMRQLLQNLIANALKFHRAGVAPVVAVRGQAPAGSEGEADGSAPGPASCRIEVADNGIGFDEKYLDRIFNVFQRLHGRNEYEGTGVGLAICRKIVERHGGTITARSTPGEGTTFVVTLPLTQHPPEEEAP